MTHQARWIHGRNAHDDGCSRAPRRRGVEHRGCARYLFRPGHQDRGRDLHKRGIRRRSWRHQARPGGPRRAGGGPAAARRTTQILRDPAGHEPGTARLPRFRHAGLGGQGPAGGGLQRARGGRGREGRRRGGGERAPGVVWRCQPQVLITYDDQGPYQHPDHVHASRSAQAAFTKSGIAAKLYLSAMRGSDWRKIWDALRELGLEGPDFENMDPEALRQAAASEQRITTNIDIRAVLDQKRDALFAHGSQISESWFSKLPG